jgi:hypothetical protein
MQVKLSYIESRWRKTIGSENKNVVSTSGWFHSFFNSNYKEELKFSECIVGLTCVHWSRHAES